jgi:hypothetical protein
MSLAIRLERLEAQAAPSGDWFAGVTERGGSYTVDLWRHAGDQIEMLPWGRSGTSEDDVMRKLTERLHGYPNPVTVFFIAATWEKNSAGAWQEVKPVCYKMNRIHPGGKIETL